MDEEYEVYCGLDDAPMVVNLFFESLAPIFHDCR